MPVFEKKSKKYIMVAFILLGMGAIFAAGRFSIRGKIIDTACVHIHPLINPAVDCLDSQEELIQRFDKLKKEVAGIIDASKNKGDVNRASVFFRDLNSAQWFGVNENDSYSPASLLKVPLMTALYKYAEINPILLDQKLTFDGTHNTDATETIISSEKLQTGASYTVDELIRRMIQDSDNDALLMLSKFLGQANLQQIYIDLGIFIPTSGGLDQDFLSARNYGSMFRILYNSSYLPRAMSQKALNILSGTEYNRSLSAGVPKKITVAHKFGERVLWDAHHTVIKRELHDCGVIYDPETPYTLCIMTEGMDTSTLEGVIQKISEAVYNGANK